MTYHQDKLNAQDRWHIDDIQKFSLLSKVEREDFGTHGEFVLNYLNTRDVPAWYRGSSTFQINAANNLFYALRDDAEQRTTHRVHECISCMGITPLISDKDIWQLIRMSNGSDLAFLWFILELHYKTHSVDFSINEQIILSLITHLDMVPTLRELDRILPPPQLPKKEIARRKRLKEVKLAKSRQRRRYKYEYIMPYFEKLVRPKPIVMKIILDRPDFEVTFPMYDVYKDPNYIQPNETNRWFAKYKMMTSRRIADGIVNEEIYKIFDEFSKASLKAETVQVLCEHHKIITELEKKLENELKVIARHKCLKHFDINGRHKVEVQHRIAEQLERDVAIHMDKFRKFADKSRLESMYHVLSSKSEEFSEDKEASETGFFDMYRNEEFNEETTFIDQTEDDQCLNFKEFMKFKYDKDERSENKELKTKTSSWEDTIRAQSELEKIFALKQEIYDDNHHYHGIGDCGGDRTSLSSERELDRLGGGESLPEPKKASLKEPDRVVIDEAVQAPKKIFHKPAERIQKTSMSDFTDKYIKPYDYGHAFAKTPTHSQTFFEAPGTNKPYLFDYRHIFRFKDNSTKSTNIKKAFLEALDSDIKLLNRLQDAPIDYEVPVRKCVQQMWKENMAKINEEFRLRDEYLAQHDIKKSPINYNEEYYDPDNMELMHNMLKDAMEYIAQDPKFVLASIPQSHKLPMLREWIYHRFGKVYTHQERIDLFKISAEIFRSLDKLERIVRAPRSLHFDKKLEGKYYIDYECGRMLLKRKNALKDNHDKNMIGNLMEQSRVFWFAMRPYLCSNGPPRDIYYAYLPARPQDITRFRVWKPMEYMDAKGAWEARQWKKKQQLKPVGQEFPDEKKPTNKRVLRFAKKPDTTFSYAFGR